MLMACPVRVDFGPQGRIDDPDVVLRTIQVRYGQVSGLSGEGKITIDSPSGRGTLRSFLAIEQPASLYIETADFFGTPRGILATDGSSFAFYDPQENRYTTGPAEAQGLGRFLPVALTPKELAAVLLGEVPIVTTEHVTMEVEPSGSYLLKLAGERRSQRIVVGTRDLRILSVETRGEVSMDVFLEDHDSILFAKKIRVVTPSARVEIKYTNIKLNPMLEPGTFRLQPPPGVQIDRMGAEP